MKTIEEYRRLATKEVLLPGIKPEDYHWVDPSFPMRVAQCIIEEMKHLIKMDKMREEHEAFIKSQSIFKVSSLAAKYKKRLKSFYIK